MLNSAPHPWHVFASAFGTHWAFFIFATVLTDDESLDRAAARALIKAAVATESGGEAGASVGRLDAEASQAVKFRVSDDGSATRSLCPTDPLAPMQRK